MSREFPITSSSTDEVFGPDCDLELWFRPEVKDGELPQVYGKVEVAPRSIAALGGLFFRVKNVMFDRLEYPVFVDVDLREILEVHVLEGNDQEVLYWREIIDRLKVKDSAYLSFSFNSGDLRAIEPMPNDIQ